MPDRLFSSWNADRRLLFPLLLLLVASVVWREKQRAAIHCVFLFLIISVFTIQQIHVYRQWQQASAAFDGVRNLASMVERGARVTALTVNGAAQYLPIPPIHEAVALFVIERSAFVPTLFTYPVDAAIALRYGDKFAGLATRELLFHAPTRIDLAAIRQHIDNLTGISTAQPFDYILVSEVAIATKIFLPAPYELIGQAFEGKIRLYRIGVAN